MERSRSVTSLHSRSVTYATPMIGSQKWQNTTLRDVKMCNQLIGRSDKNCDIGRQYDPVPHIRDVVVELSNNEAHKYFRDVRMVINRLQESLWEINEEIKSMTRGKEGLEKALEHRRKDIKLNLDSISLRSARPAKERDIDGADDLLNAERQHLLNLKRSLESHLKSVQSQLQVLSAARERLSRCLKERSRVLDLVCHSRPATSSGRPSTSRDGRMTPGNGRPATSSRAGFSQGFTIDPLGAYTPEVEEALREAAEAKNEAKKLRSELNDAISRTDQLRQAALNSVNNGLRGKLFETNALKRQLLNSSEHTRNAINRAQRWYDATGMTRGYHLGPVSSLDLTTRERLTRPIIGVYQRHCGNQLPEAQCVIQSGSGLDDSLATTNQNMELLRLAQARIHDNIRSKQQATQVDRSVLRMRQRKADHKWTMGAAF